MSVSQKILSMNSLINVLKTNLSFRTVTTSSALMKAEDRKQMLASLPSKDEGTAGENIMMIDSLISRKVRIFPDASTNTSLFNGQIFNEIPIISVKVSKNNTILTFADARGKPKIDRPIYPWTFLSEVIMKDLKIAVRVGIVLRWYTTNNYGIDGFKNALKGTNIAAQTTASVFSAKIVERGIKNVRVTVRGLGPGRLSALKGIQMSGLNVVSVTDTTRVSWNPPRPRKARRL